VQRSGYEITSELSELIRIFDLTAFAKVRFDEKLK